MTFVSLSFKRGGHKVENALCAFCENICAAVGKIAGNEQTIE